ncbi:MAG: hypothetical protein PHW04_06950 [Candidatus Wallbacteria bacterium]|nr:hypothetical protein [Candidatus Wallbacteria bacterium]
MNNHKADMNDGIVICKAVPEDAEILTSFRIGMLEKKFVVILKEKKTGTLQRSLLEAHIEHLKNLHR